MKHSSPTTPFSCRIDETFDHPHLTAFGGANLFVDLLRQLGLRSQFDLLPFQKSAFATFSLADELETLITAYALGCERIAHTDELERDPLLCRKLGLAKLPQHNTLYRALDRFNDEARVRALSDINPHLIGGLLRKQDYSILDIDTTVETVYGSQQGSCVAYNPRAHGRPSYQPLLAFDGRSRAAVQVELRSGLPPDADAKAAFYRAAKDQLSHHAPVRLQKCHFQAETERQGPTSSIFRAKKRVGFPIYGLFPRWFQWTELSVPHLWGMTPHRSKIIEFHRCRKTFSRKDWAGENRPFSDMDLGNAVLAVRKITTAGDLPPAVHAFPH